MSIHVNPYSDSAASKGEETKKKQVERMFDNISQYYDVLNRVLTLGIDTIWRKKAVNLLPQKPGLYVMDMATGTADVALEIIKQRKDARVLGIDISNDMLKVGREKINKKALSSQIELITGASEAIDYPDNTFDAATVSFGVRNFEDTIGGLSEMRRVIKPGGKIIVLEFSRIRTFPFKQAFNLYFGRILPWIGKVWSSDPRAYSYLYESVQAFPDGKEFGNLLESAGFVKPSWQALTLGICTVYTATVPSS
ncbi:MAG: bifunctional demethylmenaquinone methyltransferase/2-methoxy-6-polyprenyl-1,4-benzoquinol methylase UbiE [Saprospiraceae bacterium]